MPVTRIAFAAPNRIVNERSAFAFTARFRDKDAEADVTPTTVQYRVDDIYSNVPIADWTTVTPGTTVTIAITADQNKIQDNSRRTEKKQITVAADYGLATAFVDTLV